MWHSSIRADRSATSYENPLYLAEEAAALDLLSDGRVALGISRGSPEPARRGWEAFGYEGDAPAGADMAREKFAKFMRAVRGETMTDADPAQFGPGQRLRVEPHSPSCTSTSGGAPAHATQRAGLASRAST